MPTIEISTHTMARLQKVAQPLIDTPDSVISRLLDGHETSDVLDIPGTKAAGPGQPVKDDGAVMLFDWRNPPVLAHTTINQVVLNGEQFAKGDNYWNTIMYALIRATHKHGKTAEQLKKLLFVNNALGMKIDNGYKFMQDVGLSVQGQNSDNAFRQSFALAEHMKFKLEVFFRWQNKPEAAFPNRTGAFTI